MKKDKRKKRKKKKSTQADKADRYDLYQRSVQMPEGDIEFFDECYQTLRGRRPQVLREDFCGTGYLATEWAKSHPDGQAFGVDLDAPTLEWGREHNLVAAAKSVSQRVHLLQGNVLNTEASPADVTCALNFSYCVFKTRDQLLDYFKAVHRGLKPDGVFITELYGGTEAIEEAEEEREEDGFDYVWEQEQYNPITSETLCHIHFDFDDGSRLERAFTYDWRLWTIPEVRELLLEAGFPRVDVHWEDVDEDGDGSGDYRITEEEENQEGWIIYLVAPK